MKLCKHDLVLCCDATNTLGSNFLEIAISVLDKDKNACSISGPIKLLKKGSLTARWQARHLFKDYITYDDNTVNLSGLITYGTLMKKSVILKLGNFDPLLRHSEDAEMAERINESKYYSLGHSNLEIFCNVQNSLFEVFERYWRWHIGKDEKISLKTYLSNIKCSIKPMAQADLNNKDYFAVPVSLFLPHYYFCKSIINFLSKK